MPFGFSKKKDKASPAPASDNPYAAAPPPTDNPYAQAPQSGNPYGASAYEQARQNAYSAPPQGASGGINEPEKPSGYGSSRYGASGGYGSDRYGTGDSKPQQSRYGGYGGYGGGSRYGQQQQEDPNKNALFGNASERVAKVNANPPPYDSGAAAGDFRGGSDFNQPYNPGPKYDDRQLTAEEEEEEHVNATKQEIRATKQKDVAATRNALRMAQQAEEVGRDTLARLGVQAEYIHNTERNLDLAYNQNKQAEDKARELKTLNRSMFAIHVSNPLTSKSRDEARNAAVIARHEEERAAREGTRREQFLAHQRMEKNFNEIADQDSNRDQLKQKNLAERSKYQFEADSEDEEMENEIDGNLHALQGVVGNMKRIAIATGQEVDSHNERLRKVHEKSDKVDVGIASNTARLNRIR